ncbi:type II toxin-antitoxin system PemK/MazF family toxin [Heyndrickxia oleronia]|uniref:type II toxin-antitoxin system PemK/MazF family toxin n=1 Tax=Heyndrickxia oleronia TaxID=38875 RepID=UPI0007170881
MVIKRGEIYFFDLGIEKNTDVQAGIRPCLVISNNLGNKHSNTLIILPISIHTKANLPVHIKITENDLFYGKIKDSYIMCEQIRVIDKKSIIKFVGKLRMERLQHIKHTLLISTGFQDVETISQ